MGRVIVVTGPPPGAGKSDIDGSNLTQLTHGDSENPDWGTHPLT